MPLRLVFANEHQYFLSKGFKVTKGGLAHETLADLIREV